MTELATLSKIPNAFPRTWSRSAIVHELRQRLPMHESLHKALPFGLAAVDSHLAEGGLAGGALHEVVPAMHRALPAALGFVAAFLARLFSPSPLVFIMPVYARRQHGRLSGHGLNALGLNPARLILIETAHRRDTLWAMAEALRSAAPAAVVGLIDKLDLKTSQKLHLAAGDAGLPLLLLRPAPTLEASAAATRWRVGTAEAARDRFGLYARPRWHLQLERARNGRLGEWVMEYDHVAHRFSLAAALADPAFSRGASDGAAGQSQAGRS
jgi:protein ImuA